MVIPQEEAAEEGVASLPRETRNAFVGVARATALIRPFLDSRKEIPKS